MIKLLSSILLATSLLSGAVSAADLKLFKTFDGKVVYCHGKKDFDATSFDKAIQIEIVNQTVEEEFVQSDLQMTLVKCVDNRWVLDSSPSNETTQAVVRNRSTNSLDNVRVETAYRNYEFFAIDEGNKVFAQGNLDLLEKNGKQLISLKLPSDLLEKNSLEIFVRTISSFQASNGTRSDGNRYVIFGSYRLELR